MVLHYPEANADLTLDVFLGEAQWINPMSITEVVSTIPAEPGPSNAVRVPEPQAEVPAQTLQQPLQTRPRLQRVSGQQPASPRPQHGSADVNREIAARIDAALETPPQLSRPRFARGRTLLQIPTLPPVQTGATVQVETPFSNDEDDADDDDEPLLAVAALPAAVTTVPPQSEPPSGNAAVGERVNANVPPAGSSGSFIEGPEIKCIMCQGWIMRDEAVTTLACAHVYHTECVSANLRARPELCFENVCPLKCHTMMSASAWETQVVGQNPTQQAATQEQAAEVGDRRVIAQAKVRGGRGKAKAKPKMRRVSMPEPGVDASSVTTAAPTNTLAAMFISASEAARDFAIQDRIFYHDP